ncbi:MAG: rhomboid family intramembrane serine protease [Phocaeicola sp.]|uniref:rhomboid family intramembrane serine protease n=1 Tax=Phocaeicola sp. TaxID=2773926 RepID=UPI003FA0F673
MNNLPPITKNLLIINALCFLGMFAAQKYGIDLTEFLGLHFFLASQFNPIQIITYMFMHANFEHIFFNMFALWMFGRTLESVWGSKRYLIYYLLCGIGAGVIQEIVQFVQYEAVLSNYQAIALRSSTIPMSEYLNMMTTVGASGAIYGILIGFGMLFPNAEMFIIPIPFPVKAKYFVVGYVVLELFLGIFTSSDGVAHFAHLGGMLVGFILIKYWKNKGQIGQYNF